MSKMVYATIETSLASDVKSQPVIYDWRLILRRGRPFMLLSSRPALARGGLESLLGPEATGQGLAPNPADVVPDAGRSFV